MATKQRYGNQSAKNAAREHANAWRDCDACGLCEIRNRVVLWRGELPSDVTFVGEAPGMSEDALGYPFIGEAGRELNKVIADALGRGWEPNTKARFRYSITNITACMPKEDGKIRDPKRHEAEACKYRLEQFLEIANPKLVVLLGKIAARYFTFDYPTIELAHPAAIARAEGSDRVLKYERAVVTLATRLEKLARGFRR